jgi:hypothetical protein
VRIFAAEVALVVWRDVMLSRCSFIHLSTASVLRMGVHSIPEREARYVDGFAILGNFGRAVI